MWEVHRKPGLHMAPLHLAETDSIWTSLSTHRQQKSQTALTLLEKDSTFAIGIPYSRLSGSSLLPFWVFLKDHFIVRLQCSLMRPRTSSHLVPRPHFLYTRPDAQVGGWPSIPGIPLLFSLFKLSLFGIKKEHSESLHTYHPRRDLKQIITVIADILQ